MSILSKIFKKEKIIQEVHPQVDNSSDFMNQIKRITPNPAFQFSIDIVDHCNLNCKGCDHFCPIVEKKFLSIEQYEKDLKRLAELCENGKLITMVAIEGGEPLLHPDVIEFMKVTRQYCPNAKIYLMTNAILLPQMNEDFYMACNKYNITIAITKYPLKIDFEKIHTMAKKYQAELYYFNDFDKIEKTSWKIPFDLEGRQQCQENFINCFKANNCVVLRDGKLFTCPTRAYAYRINEYFNKSMTLSDEDYISIYDAESFQEIIAFLARPIPFCKYCNVEGRQDLGKFEISKKEIEEWI